MSKVTFSDLAEPVVPGVDDWNDNGFVWKQHMIPDELIDHYREDWEEVHGRDWPPNSPLGWGSSSTPYRFVPSLSAICSYGPLAAELERLLGEPAGVHLNLTGFVSTERNWHQDNYLNPPHVGDAYAAVWIALEDIDLTSGPFQYVSGSHRWGRVTRELTMPHLSLEEQTDTLWPKYAERFMTQAFEDEIDERQVEVSSYKPSKGDVFIWHSRLVHRGSVAILPGSHRRSLIAHYSGINHRQDMPPAVRVGDGWEFPL